jgi:hypothetical protein
MAVHASCGATSPTLIREGGKRRSAARTGACVGGVRGYLAQISLSAPSQLAPEGTHTIGRMGDSQGEHGGFAQDTGGQER